jgi:hypothetical protein
MSNMSGDFVTISIHARKSDPDPAIELIKAARKARRKLEREAQSRHHLWARAWSALRNRDWL